VKNPFLEVIQGVDRNFNRVLGRASYKSIFSIIEESAPGSTFIVDAWFGFQSMDILRDHVARAAITDVVELWCHAPPETVGERYGNRAGKRLPGHPGLAYVAELIELAREAQPCGIGPVLHVDTTGPVEMEQVLDWIRTSFEHKSGAVAN